MPFHVCEKCTQTWNRRPDRADVVCPSCQAERPTHYRLALAVTDYRLAIELAASALRLGRPREEALAHLEAVL